jgi:hypothetical protein
VLLAAPIEDTEHCERRRDVATGNRHQAQIRTFRRPGREAEQTARRQHAVDFGGDLLVIRREDQAKVRDDGIEGFVGIWKLLDISDIETDRIV